MTPAPSSGDQSGAGMGMGGGRGVAMPARGVTAALNTPKPTSRDVVAGGAPSFLL